MYSDGIAGDNCQRGVQEADSQGNISFTTIVPGCHDGRMPHVHFGVYPGMAKAGGAANKIRISQFIFPLATLDQAYAASGYGASVRKLAQLNRASEMVFADGTALQMAGVTGNAAQGYVVPPGSRRFPLNRRRGTAVEAASH